MERILAKLKQKGVLNTEVKQRLEEFWFHCVEKISDEQIKTAVVYLLEEVVPWQFFVAPASSSATFHPTWQVRPGGLEGIQPNFVLWQKDNFSSIRN